MSSDLLSMLAVLMFAMQSIFTPQTDPTKDANPAVTPTGCVSPDASTPSSSTLSDAKTGARYGLRGVDGQQGARQGEIVVGTGGRRVVIRGGLVPSTNVAAQAGNMDVVQAAIANLPGGVNSVTGNAQLVDFNVTRLRTLSGACPQTRP